MQNDCGAPARIRPRHRQRAGLLLSLSAALAIGCTKSESEDSCTFINPSQQTCPIVGFPEDSSCTDVSGDNSNCGACGVSCQVPASVGVGTCIDSVCKTASAVATPGLVVDLATDADYVYWTGDHDVARVAKTGGAIQELSTNELTPAFIVLDASHVYFMNHGQGTIVRLAKDGSERLVLSDNGGDGAIAVDGADMYWLGAGLQHVAAAGGPVTTLAQLDMGANLSALAVDAASIYWGGADAIMKLARAGGMPVVFASGQPSPVRLAVDATEMVWITADGDVRAATLDGGSVRTLGEVSKGLVAGLALDEEFAYVSPSEGPLVALPRASGAAKVLGPSGLFGVAVDATTVYWGADGDVLKVPKP